MIPLALLSVAYRSDCPRKGGAVSVLGVCSEAGNSEGVLE